MVASFEYGDDTGRSADRAHELLKSSLQRPVLRRRCLYGLRGRDECTGRGGGEQSGDSQRQTGTALCGHVGTS
ncbi:hypothetical protein GCM10010278_23770 [Streptomyces melanogenes]|nr:hypothetical protein GCM10010278_23770 [Streptomyces melanogenes]